MKHNLSNKPKADFTVNASRETMMDFVFKIVEWDDGFKEELQQLKQKMQLDLPKIPLEEKELPCYIKGSLTMIDEFLGENQ